MRKRKNDYLKNMYQWLDCYTFWSNRLYDMIYTAIKWDGLPFAIPDTIELPEKWLVDKGQCVIFEDEVEGFLCLPCIGEGRLTQYGVPASYQAYGMDGYTRTGLLPQENCVVICNDPLRQAEHMNINMFAIRLANSMITGDINITTHRTPLMLLADDDQRLTAENLLAEYTGCAAKVFGNKSLSNVELKVLDLKSPYIVDKITENTQSIWNEWLNYLGVPGQVVQKRERMLRDEIQQTMGGCLASRVPRMRMRDKACNSLKNVFGWNVSVDYAVDYIPIPKYISNGGENSEINIHGNGSYADTDTIR